MNGEYQLSSVVESAIERLTGSRPGALSVSFRPLRGGLTAHCVLVARATYYDKSGLRQSMKVVIKQLDGHSTRERRIYEELVISHAGSWSPKLLGTVTLSPRHSLLLLEAVRAVPWPWRDTRQAELVLQRLAAFHVATRAIDSPAVEDWPYEDSLDASASRTYDALLSCRTRPELSGLLKAAPATRRIVLGLRACRRALHAFAPSRRCILHGDLHPGNVLIRRGGREQQPPPVFLDWERARPGSPLEDVSSWLHSLGFWEPEVRRRHDSLFRAYLVAAGWDPKLTPDLRAAYWIAGASNALAGALHHHLALLQRDDVDAHRRGTSARAAFAWLRLVRRADALWH